LMNHFEYETAIEVVQQSYAQFETNRRPAGSKRSLADLMQARHRVLEELGYAEGWKLTSDGQLLRSLYHECDLLIAECLQLGIFDDLEPAQLAGLLSSFVFEAKRSARSSKAPQTPVKKKKNLHDRLGPERRMNLNDRMSEISVISARLREVEARHKVHHAKEPDGKFIPVIAAWARGASLSTVLDLADVEVGTTSPGDFVRNAKQVADLCEQVGRLSTLPSVASAALDARDAVLRSVVAGASTIHQLD